MKTWTAVSRSVLGAVLLAVPAVANAQAWTEVWSDGFNGTGAANAANWTYETGGGGWGNSELQYYQGGTKNASQDNGVLTIQARRQSVGGMAYTSARIKTQGKRSFGPGDDHPVKIEARLAGPNKQGLWPAFWMLGTDITTVPWPGCGEIDIMEHINTAGNTWGTIHWNGPAGYAYYTAATPPVDFQSFNWYAITWNKNEITWLTNGEPAGSADISNNVNSTEEFHRPFFIVLNMAVGGSWPGSPDGSTVFPANYRVDAVRYLRR